MNCFVLERAGRSTGMGAYTDTHLFSVRQQKEILPHRRTSSRTGRHWSNIWYLLPGRYLVATYDRTNSGKESIIISLLTVKSDLSAEEEVLIRNDEGYITGSIPEKFEWIFDIWEKGKEYFAITPAE